MRVDIFKCTLGAAPRAGPFTLLVARPHSYLDVGLEFKTTTELELWIQLDYLESFQTHPSRSQSVVADVDVPHGDGQPGQGLQQVVRQNELLQLWCTPEHVLLHVRDLVPCKVDSFQLVYEMETMWHIF